ncbi:hypothetical protein MMC15_006598 [Xylographa vitiligo]|nr:hypothetical protein [Xylographa vitiligo]
MAFHYGADIVESPSARYGSPPPTLQLPPLEHLYVPLGFNLEPMWVRQNYYGDWRRDCAEALHIFPPNGAINSITRPLLGTNGRCTIGLYFSEPKPNGDPEVKEQWANIQNWVSASIDLYLAFSNTGFTMDFISGIQVTVFEPRLVNLDPKRIGKSKWVMESLKYIIDDTLSGNRGRGRARGQNRGRMSSSGLLPSATTDPAMSLLSSPGSPTVTSLFAGFTDVDHLMPSWAGQSPLDRDDCKAAIFEIAMVTWFYAHAGLFFDKPYIFNYDRCALGLYLTNPPTNGQALFVPFDRTNMEVMLYALLIHTVIDHRVPGFADIRNGMQIAYWDWEYLDPQKQCWKTKKLSMRRCLDILAMRKVKALASVSISSTIVPTLPDTTASASSSITPGFPLITSPPSLPYPTGSQTGAQTFLSMADLASSLAGLGIN